LQIGDNEPTTVEMEVGVSVDSDGPAAEASVSFEITLAHGNSDEEVFDVGAADPRTVDRRDVTTQFYTRGKHRISADSAVYDVYAESQAELNGARRGATFVATCGDEETTFRW
jgi:hypothetical protein